MTQEDLSNYAAIVTKPKAEVYIEGTSQIPGGMLSINIERGVIDIYTEGRASYNRITLPLEKWDSIVKAVEMLRTTATVIDRI